jgi:hypothetical protein
MFRSQANQSPDHGSGCRAGRRKRERLRTGTPAIGRGYGCRRGNGRRRGLAPVELVLAIPLVMFVTALAVIAGTAACWKTRTAVVARDAIWSHRWPRGGAALDPLPAGWPQQRTSWQWSRRDPFPELDHAAFDSPVVRGPLPNVQVNDTLFDPTRGLRYGEAEITRTPAALARLGDYRFDVAHPLLDGKWQYGQQGIGSNRNRRFPVLYTTLPDASPALRAQFDRAYQAIVSAPFRPALFVLDRDDEFRAWYGSSPDFHPRLQRFCSLDVQDVYDRHVLRLIADIDGQPPPNDPRYDPPGVPRNMTNAFLRLYRSQLRALENIPPENRTPAQEARIAELQRLIAILEAFLATLN